MDIWKDIREQLHNFNTNFEFLNNIGEVIKNYPNFNVDCLSKGQLASKIWAVQEIKNITKSPGNINLLCGWYAIIAEMLFENLKVGIIRSYDLDPDCTSIADELNISHVINGWRFKSFVADINSDLEYISVGTVINTSCEHVKSNQWFKNIPDGRLVVLQSNNGYDIADDHINCVDSVEEMKQKYKMSHILYDGELDVINFKRFMLIGIK